jgi:hypothetical protein
LKCAARSADAGARDTGDLSMRRLLALDLLDDNGAVHGWIRASN